MPKTQTKPPKRMHRKRQHQKGVSVKCNGNGSKCSVRQTGLEIESKGGQGEPDVATCNQVNKTCNHDDERCNRGAPDDAGRPRIRVRCYLRPYACLTSYMAGRCVGTRLCGQIDRMQPSQREVQSMTKRAPTHATGDDRCKTENST